MIDDFHYYTKATKGDFENESDSTLFHKLSEIAFLLALFEKNVSVKF